MEALWDINHGHLRAGLLIDTNLLVLYLIGRYDVRKLGKFRATKKYSAEIFRLLESLIVRFTSLHATPNILTEVDNLSRQVSSEEWIGVSGAFSKLVAGLEERSLPSVGLVAHSAHAEIGVTDCSILEMAAHGVLVATDDLPLTIQLERRRLGVINLSRFVPLAR